MYRDPALEPGLGLGLVAGTKINEGPVPCGLGAGQGPRPPDPLIKTVLIGFVGLFFQRRRVCVPDQFLIPGSFP